MKILKKNQLAILVIALMLVTAGYLNYTASDDSVSTGANVVGQEQYAAIGDATLVNSGELIEENDKIVMSYKKEKNKYTNKQKLYINKSTLKPENLQIYDINNDCRVDIVYNEIEFNI